MSELFIGIVSGIVTSLIVFFFHRVYLQVIRPWYEERVYSDARIEGRWGIRYLNMSVEAEEQITITRIAHSLSGQIVVTSGPDSGKVYSFQGTFKNLILTITYSALDKTALDRGAYVMQLNGNGNQFSGRSAYYHDDHSIVAAECIWTRQST